VALTLKSTLNIDKLYYNELLLDIGRFMINAFGEVMIFYNGYYCLNAGWKTEDILLSVQTSMKFQNCYKMIVQSFTDWTNWTMLGKYPTT
jgi:hypothetical protein